MLHIILFIALFFNIDMQMSLNIDGSTISRTSGGIVHFRLIAADPQMVGAQYLIMGGVTGTVPGYVLPNNVNLPLNIDWATSNILYFTFSNQYFHYFIGYIPECCIIDAVLDCPPLSNCDINVVYFAACAILRGQWGTSNSVEVLITD